MPVDPAKILGLVYKVCCVARMVTRAASYKRDPCQAVRTGVETHAWPLDGQCQTACKSKPSG